MVDKLEESKLKFGSSDKNKWYEEHVLSEEELNLLIKSKFERYKNYQSTNNLVS